MGSTSVSGTVFIGTPMALIKDVGGGENPRIFGGGCRPGQ